MKPVNHAVLPRDAQPLPPTDLDARRVEDLFLGSSISLRFQPGQSIVVQGDRIDNLYQIVAGTVRCCSFTTDGRRQIFRFARAGDLLGFVDPTTWHFSAEAVDFVVMRSIPASRLVTALGLSADLREDLRAHVAKMMAERERQLSILAFKPATQRVLWFLQDFAERHGKAGFLTLPMTRQEIGDFLGLSLETVSRSFSILRSSGMIEMKGAERFRIVYAAGKHRSNGPEADDALSIKPDHPMVARQLIERIVSDPPDPPDR